MMTLGHNAPLTRFEHVYTNLSNWKTRRLLAGSSPCVHSSVKPGLCLLSCECYGTRLFIEIRKPRGSSAI